MSVEPPRDALGEVLCCLFRGGKVPDRVLKWLREMGIDPASFQRCLERLCATRNGQTEREPCCSKRSPGQVATVNPNALQTLRTLLDELARDE